IGPRSKVPHLSYVGDATVGEGTNIGAGTIVVNYDGVSKSHTVVGDHVRIGSDNTLIAPVTVGDGAYTGAGSIIREDVPPGALGINEIGRASCRERVQVSGVAVARTKEEQARSSQTPTKRHREVDTHIPI